LQDLCQDLQQALQLAQEGELIAQLWAWRTSTSLVFDSWERLRAEDDRLCELFLKAAAKQAINTCGMEKVLIGKNGNTPQRDNSLRKLVNILITEGLSQQLPVT
jgi:hypothetical protein